VLFLSLFYILPNIFGIILLLIISFITLLSTNLVNEIQELRNSLLYIQELNISWVPEKKYNCLNVIFQF
jgi:hypothetical protein